MALASGYINSNGGREHVAVVIAALGQLLPSGWEVHHVNERKDDNRPENLVACETRRLHHVLHALPELLDRCVWLGEPGRSVRVFRAFDPPSTYFCLRCKRSKPLSLFQRSRRYASGVRGECSDCRGRIDRRRRRRRLLEYRKTHPVIRVLPPPRPGAANPAAKLTADNVIEIRRRYAEGETQTALAAEFKVSQSTISLIVLRKKWRCVR